MTGSDFQAPDYDRRVFPFNGSRVTFDPKVGFLVTNASRNTDMKRAKCFFHHGDSATSIIKQLEVIRKFYGCFTALLSFMATTFESADVS